LKRILIKTRKQKKEVTKVVVAEVCVSSDTPPAFPHKITVLEKAIRQKGHLGSSTRKIVVSSPIGFFPLETILFFLHGLQSSLILETVIIP